MTIELVPTGQWGTNLRSVLKRGEWDRLRKWCYEQAGHTCEICGASGLEQNRAHAVECHERWEYDDSRRIQKLLGVISLCPRCHQVKHFGRALAVGAGRFAINHMRKVNGWSVEVAKAYVEGEFATHTIRSLGPAWCIDLRWLGGDSSPLTAEISGAAVARAMRAGAYIVLDDAD